MKRRKRKRITFSKNLVHIRKISRLSKQEIRGNREAVIHGIQTEDPDNVAVAYLRRNSLRYFWSLWKGRQPYNHHQYLIYLYSS